MYNSAEGLAQLRCFCAEEGESGLGVGMNEAEICQYFSENDSDSPQIPEYYQTNIPEMPGLDEVMNSESLLDVSLSLFDKSFLQNEKLNSFTSHNCLLFEKKEKIPKPEMNNTQATQTPSGKISNPEPPKPKSLRKTPKETFSRWGRRNDKILFQTIRDMEQQDIITLDELINPDPSANLGDYEGIQQLCRRSGWKSSPAKLLARIQSLIIPEFSFRETKNLKKILRNTYNYENVDYNQLIYEFPGKTMSVLQKTTRTLIEAYHNKDLSSFRNNRKKSVKEDE